MFLTVTGGSKGYRVCQEPWYQFLVCISMRNTWQVLSTLFSSSLWVIMTSSQIGRTGKQIRERWHNQLDPDIKKDSWTQEEDRALIEAYQVYKIILFVAAYF
jgi:hypothetical protein